MAVSFPRTPGSVASATRNEDQGYFSLVKKPPLFLQGWLVCVLIVILEILTV